MAQPIGIFDSGFGGLSVASVLARQLPDESLYYFGDTARCPYGERSQDEVKHFSYEISKWLVKENAKLIVIACNTATAAAIETLRSMLDVPVIGVICAGAQGCVDATRSGKIGVLATRGTVDSMSYVDSIHDLLPDAEVIQQPAPSFVHIVEDGLMNYASVPNKSDFSLQKIFDTPENRQEIRNVLAPLVEADVDTICLGCTHFPLLAPLIAQEIPDHIKLVNPADGVALEIKQYLDSAPNPDVVYRFATTAPDIEKFAYAIQAVFPYEANSVMHVDVSDLDALDSQQL